MRIQSLLVKVVLISVSALNLSSCGGGGGSTGSGVPISPAPLPTVDVSAVAMNDPGSALPAGWDKGAFMEIFVRSYQDSDGDGKGDLKGLISRLDYLKDLGVKGLWLMPMSKSQDGDHGYAVSDYRDIEAAYGSLADLDELLRQAHARGIGVILDYVMNHSAGLNPLFVNSRDSTTNPYRDWYVWQSVAPAGWSVFGGNPWRTTTTGAYYAPFWDQMPDFNLKNPAVLRYHQDNLRFWLNRGVDGIRFDAVGNLVENGPSAWLNQPENYTIMGSMKALAASYSQRYIVCEAPDDPKGFAASTACGSAFAFGLQYDIVNAAKGLSMNIQRVSDYFKTAPLSMATMLSNHDSFAGERMWDQFAGNLAQYKLAAATYLLLPGRPFIYYGEEIGMAGAASLTGDAKLRTPMSWNSSASNAGFSTTMPYRAISANVATNNVATQAIDPNSLYMFYKAMLALRNTRPSITLGSYDAPFVSGNVMGFQRKQGGETSLILINYGTSDANVSVTSLPAFASLGRLFPSAAASYVADANGTVPIVLAAQSVSVFNVTP